MLKRQTRPAQGFIENPLRHPQHQSREAGSCLGRKRAAGDEMVLEAAVNGQAQAIVALNHRDYGNAPTRFGILLQLPAESYKRIEA